MDKSGIGGLGRPLSHADALLLEAVDALRAAAPGRVAVFSPGAGGDRPLYLASTTVIIDDVYVVTGTTHLWRRGLSFDSSLSCALFDERVTNGRCTEVTRFRTALMARRLGVPVTALPLDPAELVVAIRDLDQRGSARLAAAPIKATAPPGNAQGYPTVTDSVAWNCDGSVDVADLLRVRCLRGARVRGHRRRGRRRYRRPSPFSGALRYTSRTRTCLREYGCTPGPPCDLCCSFRVSITSR